MFGKVSSKLPQKKYTIYQILYILKLRLLSIIFLILPFKVSSFGGVVARLKIIFCNGVSDVDY
ncbi:MAG: hypothetical protein JJE21_08215 [Spirochaetaceae bacterium]|nr:hypothetical protein [Spirochaetaceae bacterium]